MCCPVVGGLSLQRGQRQLAAPTGPTVETRLTTAAGSRLAPSTPGQLALTESHRLHCRSSERHSPACPGGELLGVSSRVAPGPAPLALSPGTGPPLPLPSQPPADRGGESSSPCTGKAGADTAQRPQDSDDGDPLKQCHRHLKKNKE